MPKKITKSVNNLIAKEGKKFIEPCEREALAQHASSDLRFIEATACAGESSATVFSLNYPSYREAAKPESNDAHA